MRRNLTFQGPTESTPLPGRLKIRNHRVAELQEEYDVLNETAAVSFTDKKELDSPFFDKTKSKSYYQSCFEQVELLGLGCFAAVYKVSSRSVSTPPSSTAIARVRTFRGPEMHLVVKLSNVRLLKAHYCHTAFCGLITFFFFSSVDRKMTANCTPLRRSKSTSPRWSAERLYLKK